MNRIILLFLLFCATFSAVSAESDTLGSTINRAEKTVLTSKDIQKVLGIKSWVLKLKKNTNYIISLGSRNKSGKFVPKTHDYDCGTKKSGVIKVVLRKNKEITLLGDYSQAGPDEIDLNLGASVMWIKPEFKNGYYKLAVCKDKEMKFLHTVELKVTENKLGK